PRHAPAVVVHHRDGSWNSSNWSGYAVTGANGSVTDVRGSWVVPAVTCPGGANQYASFWVGIDGFSSNTVEQTGTDSDCQNGTPTYYAWFEFYPHPSFLVNNFSVQPNDVISAVVHYDSGRRQFTVTLTNSRTGQVFSTSTRVNSAQRSSAEWIAEAPSSGGILPPANFGTVNCSADTATVNGTSGSIGGFGASNIQQITMVTSGGATKAQPSSLSGDGSGFSVTWVSSGP